MHELPPLAPSGVIPTDHFPTRMQCFIFRNWEIIEPEVLAAVLGCSADTVSALAAEMGLPVPPKVSPAWRTKGYITIIRANWHLCSYEQIAQMLGWTVEHLAFILREDDFLSHKLGFTKPELPPLVYVPLTEAERAATARIRAVVEEAQRGLPTAVEPFDFAPMFAEAARSVAGAPIAQPRFRERIIYSYCALYGDTFADRALLDASFPDELLAAYAALGVTGVWTQAVLYTLAPYPFEPSLSAGCETRLEGMRYLVAKLARHGLKLFLYLNEPRAMPLDFFAAHPDLRGRVDEGSGYACLCVSTPEVQAYLRGASRFLCENVPGLGGYLTITASENLTNCYSHARAGGCTCLRCAKRQPSEVYADVNRCLWEGAASVDPNFTVLAWNWSWGGRQASDTTRAALEAMPREIGVMCVSEERVKKLVGGVETSVIDYSISVEGPGDYARGSWAAARETGHPAYAKLQLGNTWEMAAVPCVPAFEKIYRHLRRIAEEGMVDGVMLGWTLGGFPSPTLAIAQAFYDAEHIPTLEEIYAAAFPGGDIPALTAAFHQLSEAFDEFPFHLGVAYYAPQLYGCANLLYPAPTGYHATMVGFPYDDLDKWRAIYPRQVFIGQLEKLSTGWHVGAEMLADAIGQRGDAVLASLLRWTQVIDCHFRSMVNQCKFIVARENGEINAAIAADEAKLAREMLAHVCADPTVGYESSNHYFFTKNALLEKIVNCDYLMQTAKN
ncbi:MAG: hypothetical protein IJX53_01850 [Clostridia bacterium]|nr:hypothetical protein [Clostridia bacterium]